MDDSTSESLVVTNLFSSNILSLLWLHFSESFNALICVSLDINNLDIKNKCQDGVSAVYQTIVNMKL